MYVLNDSSVVKFVAESADSTSDYADAELGAVVLVDGNVYLKTEYGLELLGEDTSEEVTQDSSITTTTTNTKPTSSSLSYNDIISAWNIAGEVVSTGTNFSLENKNYSDYSDSPNTYSTASNTDTKTSSSTSSSTGTKTSSSTAKGIVPVGTVLSIGGKFYLVIEGGVELIGEGDPIPEGSSGGVSSTTITTITFINIDIKTNTYTYYGGDRAIDNYNYGAVVKLLSDYQGIGLNGYSFYVNSSSGQLEIQDSRDKLIGYSGDDGKIVAYSYVASTGGIIDGRKKSASDISPNAVKVDAAEILIGADNADNQIYAGNAGSSLWGGNGGSDVLTGGDGYDEFFYAIGSGNDVVKNAGSDDIVNLLEVSLEQISGVDVQANEVTLNFTDGGSLKVEGNAGTGYKLGDVVYTVDQNTGQWSQK